jgi:methylase of polypeptide subunit release factors
LNGAVTAIARLRADLAAANFTVDALTDLWGGDAAAALHRGHRVPALRALTARTPLATLAQCFVLSVPVPPEELATALPTLGVDGAVELGLTTPDGVPLLDLRPYSVVDTGGVVSWWIASDLGELALGHALGEHHVLGVGGASTTLSGLMMALPVDVALDLGTGCGIQALHAARHAARVIATDISPRALVLARLNAELNAVTNIEFRLGSLFEPIEGERFGHVVSNPPFVITPRTIGVPEYEYRDGGLVGDALVASVIRDVGEHLELGGFAQLLGNWEYSGEPGLDRVRRWLGGTHLDAWVVERERQSVEQYAETWIRDGGTRPGAEFDRLYEAWLDDFANRGVTEVGFGYVTLRRPKNTGTTLQRFEHYDAPLGGSLGDHISSVFAAHDWLAARDDAVLATETLTIASDVTEERHYWPGAEDPTLMLLHQGSGFARTVPVGTALAAVVGACDGTLSLGAICSAVAHLLDVDERQLTAELIPAVRELVLDGFLVV